RGDCSTTSSHSEPNFEYSMSLRRETDSFRSSPAFESALLRALRHRRALRRHAFHRSCPDSRRTLASGLFLMFLQAQPAPLPSAEDTLAYLNQAIDWYRHLSVEEEIAVDPADVRFFNDDRQVAKQVLQLSFDFARSNAKLLARQK